MSGSKDATVESDWTKENVKKLLAEMKTNIPQQHKMLAYSKGMKDMDWEKVAFASFSPEECQEKWREMFDKMRKIRTLTELIDEADDVISNPTDKMIYPGIPKKPSPPNAIFYFENRAKFQKKHLDMKNKDVFTLLNVKYKGLSDKKKARYLKKHKQETEEYNTKMLVMGKQYGIRKYMTGSKRLSSSPLKDKESQDAVDLPPRPPPSGYNLFCKEHPDISKHNLVKVWAQCWRDLDKSQRDEYNTRCAQLKKEHAIKLKKYLTTLGEGEKKQALDQLGIKSLKDIKTEAESNNRFSGEPKMPCRNSNSVFIKDQMLLLKGVYPNQREAFSKAAKMWKHLSSKDKERYRGESKKKLENYREELLKWLETLQPRQREQYLACNPSKRKYLCAATEKKPKKEEVLDRPSDSEDEAMADSSEKDEDEYRDFLKDALEEEEEEEDDEDEESERMFRIYW